MKTTYPSASTESSRILAIDVLRGFDMFWIIGGAAIFTNLATLIPPEIQNLILTQLSHSQWQGFTFYDLIMPLFMFIVGCSMAFSFSKRTDKENRFKLYKHVLKRFSILFLLGMIFQGNLLDLSWKTLYFYNNTLQAIAVGYLGAAIILLLNDIKKQALVTLVLLILYWLLLHFISFHWHRFPNRQ